MRMCLWMLSVPGRSANAGVAATEHQRRVWDKHAPSYDGQMGLLERLLFEGGRAWVCSRASGDVLEVAVGTGRNLPLYPEGIRLTGIELSPEMLTIARRRARELGLDDNLQQSDAQALPFLDASFDTVVCTFALCCIPDDRKAVAEMKRVLRPGGRLLLVDHVPSTSRLLRDIQWLLEQMTARLEGVYILRRSLDIVRAEGFEIETSERSKAGIVERVLARKPA